FPAAIGFAIKTLRVPTISVAQRVRVGKTCPDVAQRIISGPLFRQLEPEGIQHHWMWYGGAAGEGLAIGIHRKPVGPSAFPQQDWCVQPRGGPDADVRLGKQLW